ncbi:MAG: radical SAM protein [Desulfatiglandaceae bacterium]
MKITYIYPPLFKGFYPMATRMITENLLRDKNLEVDFSDIPIRAYSSKIHEEIFDRIISKAASTLSPNVVAFLEQKYIIYNLFYVFMAHGYYDKYILEDFDTKYVVVTVINFCDLLIVRHLLNTEKKVVIGGPLITIGLSPAFIRQFLSHMGVDQSKLSSNLIIVSGNIDLKTDLSGIIKNWKDAAITENDYGTSFECERDFLREYYDGQSQIPVHLGFSNRCWYGKCKFCTYGELPPMDFLKTAEDAKVIEYIRKMMNTLGSSHIRFIDSYFHTTSPSVQNILHQISDYDITIYTGITLLKSKSYIDFINDYVNCLLIGLESTSDFSLDHINKGYTYEDIKEAINNIIKYLDRRIFLEISVILDLPSRDREDIEINYRKIAEIKEGLISEGFKVGFHLNILSVFPNLELIYPKDGLLRRSNDPSDMGLSTGKSYLISLLRQSGMDNPPQLPSGSVLVDEHTPGLQYGYVSSDVPIVRYDIDGNVLPSDLNLIDQGIMRRILERTSRKS